MSGRTRATATPPDETDRYWLNVVIPVCRAIILSCPEHFTPEIVAKARGEATTERRGDARDETRAA